MSTEVTSQVSAIRKTSKLGVTAFLMAIGFPLFLLMMFAISLAMEGRVDHERSASLIGSPSAA
jgi:hypothetical protein